MIINSNDISVVVQGAVDKNLTPKCLKSIRQYLPKAEIILSTWEGMDTNGLDYDVLVLSKDPGAVYADKVNKVYNNTNRQIESTKKGLFKVSRQYALKIRSDMEVKGDAFLTFFGKFKKRNKELNFLKERVLVNNLYTANPIATKLLFHPSDWVMFGYTEDLLKIWDIPLSSEKEMGAWFGESNRPEIDIFSLSWAARYVPEQYIWVNFLKKHLELNFSHFANFTKENLEISELSMVNNLVVLDYMKQFPIKFSKYDPYKHDYKSQQNHGYWLYNYKKYCDNVFVIPFKYILKSNEQYLEASNSLLRHLGKFFIPIKKIWLWLRRPFVVVYYLIKLIIIAIIAISNRVSKPQNN